MDSQVRPLISLMLIIIIFTLIILYSQKFIIESFIGNRSKFTANKTIYPFESKNTLPPSTPKKKVNKDKLFCYQFPNDTKCKGDSSKKKNNIIDGSVNFPKVDGVSNNFKSLNMFAFNEKKPSCCGQSPYFGSGGCYCITNNQKKYLNNNGVVH
jgi:hypothetical protein